MTVTSAHHLYAVFCRFGSIWSFVGQCKQLRVLAGNLCNLFRIGFTCWMVSAQTSAGMQQLLQLIYSKTTIPHTRSQVLLDEMYDSWKTNFYSGLCFGYQLNWLDYMCVGHALCLCHKRTDVVKCCGQSILRLFQYVHHSCLYLFVIAQLCQLFLFVLCCFTFTLEFADQPDVFQILYHRHSRVCLHADTWLATFPPQENSVNV